METLETLKDRIVEYYRTNPTDSYGQLSMVSISSIAKTPEEETELKTLVTCNTYGGRFGTYTAFNPNGKFKDKELEQRCREAFAQNEHRKINLISW
jgi:hypothetical protein